MADLTFPLAGSISKLDSEFLKAQSDCNQALTSIARNQKQVFAQLLELAPQELQKQLQIPLHRLLAHKSTMFQINAAGEERSKNKAKLISELGIVWKEAVAVDTITEKRGDNGIKVRFTLHLRAVPHT